VLSLLFLLLVLLFFASIASAIGRASRRRRRQEEELALRPGSLFEQMMDGAWTRSYGYDPRTGEGVVSTGDLVSSLQGGSAQNIDKAFDTAMQNLPCVLFFDEFDSIAQRRGGTPDQESRRTVNQLLTGLEAHRDERELWRPRTRSSISIRPLSVPGASIATSASTSRMLRPDGRSSRPSSTSGPWPPGSSSRSSCAAPRG
jgi:hypothetical protein